MEWKTYVQRFRLLMLGQRQTRRSFPFFVYFFVKNVKSPVVTPPRSYKLGITNVKVTDQLLLILEGRRKWEIKSFVLYLSEQHSPHISWKSLNELSNGLPILMCSPGKNSLWNWIWVSLEFRCGSKTDALNGARGNRQEKPAIWRQVSN